MTDDARNTVQQIVVLENRKKLRVSGVKEVDSFDERNVTAVTTMGKMIVQGEQLKVTDLEIESGVLSVEGKIHGVLYVNDRNGKGGWLAGIFK